MRGMKQVIGIVAVINNIALIGLIVWLAASGRWSGQRVRDAGEIFSLTLAQAQEQTEAAAQAEVEAQALSQSIARLQGLGTRSTAERLAQEQDEDDITLRTLERTRRSIESLQQNLYLARKRMEEQYREMESKKEALEKEINEIRKRMDEEGFKKVVILLENLPPKQVKKMFIELMDMDQTEQVVAYLEAMKPRKAASVLKEFKSTDEVTAVAELTERLRARGSDLVQPVETISERS